MKRPGKWAWIWIAWLAALGVLEGIAARKHGPEPRTFTEVLGHWFRKKWWRVVLIGLMAALTWHFWVAPDVVPAVPLGPCEGG